MIRTRYGGTAAKAGGKQRTQTPSYSQGSRRFTRNANPVETAGAAGHCSVLTQEISTGPREG